MSADAPASAVEIQPSSGPAVYRAYTVDANGSVEGLERANGVLLPADTYYYDPYGELQQPVDGDAGKASFRFQGFTPTAL